MNVISRTDILLIYPKERDELPFNHHRSQTPNQMKINMYLIFIKRREKYNLKKINNKKKKTKNNWRLTYPPPSPFANRWISGQDIQLAGRRGGGEI